MSTEEQLKELLEKYDDLEAERNDLSDCLDDIRNLLKQYGY